MSNLPKIVSQFLNELHSNQVQETFESLNVILEHLENKADPEPIELKIVEMTYHTIEKLKHLEGLLRRYYNSSSPLIGDQLSDLYDKVSEVSTNSIFD
jgi:hypothetical protein